MIRPAVWLLVLPLAVLTSTTRDAEAVPLGPEEKALRDALSLRIRESGPERPWVVIVENRSEQVVNLVKDPRLLSMEVTVPGKRKKVSCQIPKAMRPRSADTERLRELAPGQRMRFRIDPRFYCFEGGDSGVLVPGSTIEARYGFEPSTKSHWRGGRKVVERLPSSSPYVAQFLPEEEEEDEEASGEEASPPKPESQHSAAHGQGSGNAEGAEQSSPRTGQKLAGVETETPEEHEPTPHDPKRPGLRQLDPISMTLGDAYKSWARVKLQADEESQGLRLEVVDGSDSLTARGARVTIRLSNRGARTQRIFVRRDLISFYMIGPDGLSVCSAERDERAPDGQAFTTLKPGQQITMVTRLIEFCPSDIIDRSGFYLVGAELEAEADGEEAEIDAFTGTLFTTRAKPVRIQKGELPFAHRDLPRGGVLFDKGGRLRRAPGGPPGPPVHEESEGTDEPSAKEGEQDAPTEEASDSD